MLKLEKIQDELNKFTIGENWANMSDLNGKEINWWRCIYMEAVEAIDSLDWKHWKSQENDIENLKVEIVDILHFVLSLIIVHKSDVKINIGDAVETNCSLISCLEEIIHISSSKDKNINELIKAFNKILISLKRDGIMNIEELKSLYLGKSVLNLFRQKNGYKDGSYVKIWSGVEDNVHMQKILETESDPDKIYKKLEDTYKIILKK